MNNNFLDEPLIVPTSPAEALTRLLLVRGILERDAQLAKELNVEDAIHTAQASLTAALVSGVASQIQGALAQSQDALSTLFAQLHEDNARLLALGFPTQEQLRDPFALATPNAQSVLSTFTLNGKQVLTSLAFDRVAGATAYWLHIVRYWENDEKAERIEDPVLESALPFFARVRLPVGTQTLRIKARNPSTSCLSEEFSIEVPDLTAL